MKSTFSSGAFLALAIPAVLANPHDIFGLQKRDCTGNNCNRAVRGNPEVAAPFCYTYLGRITTETETATEYTTTTTTVTETVATITEYDATVTATVLPPWVVKRGTDGPEATISSIIKACTTDAAKISSACSCFLGDATSTVTESTTATLPVTVTETATDTLTVDIPTYTVTETCYPTATPAITNGLFNTGSLAPWSSVPVGSTFKQGSAGLVQNWYGHHYAFKAGLGSSLSKSTKVKLAQDLVTCPGAKYKINFWYLFFGLRGDDAHIIVYVDGVQIFDIKGVYLPAWYFSGDATFTATSGSTNLEFDFVLKKGLTDEDVLVDGVTVTGIP
ncbi:hypothetical protein H072_2597 [Dactylellina haptotyla CBS 200.50]|uniref:CBM-cenC domain-containing protein n=1 Tax=Dactylellina haptotyla (strain CBS 200.50) TaxID=1284197 RepID=S8BVF1_DACHA|nr:hypothetical protein H072_2597 [Dactylellina haptotyla CBS 200.50]